MSSLGSPNPLLLGGAEDYLIERSIRFDGSSSYFRKNDFSGDPDSGKIFTFSAWVKRGNIEDWFPIFGGHSGTAAFNMFGISSGDRLIWRIRNSSSTDLTRLSSTRKLRDTSNWYHLVLQRDSTQATATNRAKLWVNGEQITDFFNTNTDEEDQTYSSDFLTDLHIGRGNINASTNYYADGYMADVYYIDGQALPPTSFAETDPVTGQWKPKKYTGTYGTNGAYLNFSENSDTTAATLGKDSSGNDNNFTPNNFSVAAGTGNDSLEDTPTNNFCTLNPLIKPVGTNTFSEGALKVDPSNHWNLVEATFVVNSGKWYWEQQAGGTISSTSHILFGIISHGSHKQNLAAPHAYNGTISYYDGTGQKRINNAYSTYGDSYNATGDVIGTALDMDNRTVTFYKNGTSQGSIDIDLANDNFLEAAPYCSVINATTATFNFGQRPFAYSVPADHKTLCAANLPEPTIKDPSKYFNTVLYEGDITDTSTQTVSGVGFQPDLTWIKRRSGSNSHQLVDSVRGVGKWLESNDDKAQETSNTNGVLTAFNSDGFVLTGGSTNANLCCEDGETYASWSWKESASAGFDIVTHNMSSADTDVSISHNLGTTPEFILAKNIDGSDNSWRVYHHKIGTPLTNHLYLDVNNATSSSSSRVKAVSDTAFTYNANVTGNFIFYLWDTVDYFSKVGKYIGNGTNGTGPYIWTGFRPALVLGKDTAVDNWFILDSKRNPYNPVEKSLYPTTNGQENTVANDAFDFLSNGFKFTGNGNFMNQSGNNYQYIAFAERPFKYANAR